MSNVRGGAMNFKLGHLAFAAIILIIFAAAAHADDSDDATQVKLLYTGEAWGNVQGGAKRSSLMLNNFDVNVALDADKKWGWHGASFLLDGFYNNGRTPSSLTGAQQQISALDNNGVSNMYRLYQAWYNQDLFDGKTSILAGLYDLNSEFDKLDSAALFFNSGYGWNSVLDESGRNGPSTYPNTSLALRARQYVDQKNGISFEAAVLDGVPDDPNHPHDTNVIINHRNGAMLVGEADYHPADQTKILIGYWNYTARFNDQLVTDASGNPRADTGNQGMYAGVHQRLYSLEDDKRGLDGFVNVGGGDGDINRFDRSLATGLRFTGLWEARPEDQLGLAWNIAHNSYPYRQAMALAGTPVKDDEQDYELTYRAKINDYVTLQPDMQYIVHPNTDPALKNDLIVGMHVEIGYGFGF